MSDIDDERPEPPPAEGVRIIGAEEAQSAAEQGPARPEQPSQPPRRRSAPPDAQPAPRSGSSSLRCGPGWTPSHPKTSPLPSSRSTRAVTRPHSGTKSHERCGSWS